MDASLATPLFFVFLSVVLVLLNAFFVASEFAIVKVRRTRLEELAGQGVAAARISILCVDQLDEYLSATQLGITLVSLALGWIGEDGFYNLLTYLAPEQVDESTSTFHAIAAGLSFMIITFLHVVIGELVPKSMAIQKAERITLKVSAPLRLFYRLASPLIHTFTAIANVILHAIGYKGLEEPALSEEELKLVMKDSYEEGVISDSEAQIITRAFSFSDKSVATIMLPARRIEFLSLERTFEENIALTRTRMHTRFPLCERGLDTVIGVVHMKDVLQYIVRDQSNELFRRVSRRPVLVEPTLRQDRLLKLFRERRAHMAIVQDPDSHKTVGIVTLEDVLEQLVGEITDEHGN